MFFDLYNPYATSLIIIYLRNLALNFGKQFPIYDMLPAGPYCVGNELHRATIDSCCGV